MKKFNFAPYPFKKNMILSAADIARLASTIDPCIEMMHRFAYGSNLTSHVTSAIDDDDKNIPPTS
jgi:hypothetical protein